MLLHLAQRSELAVRQLLALAQPKILAVPAQQVLDGADRAAAAVLVRVALAVRARGVRRLFSAGMVVVVQEAVDRERLALLVAQHRRPLVATAVTTRRQRA